MEAGVAPPVLSTPAVHMFENVLPTARVESSLSQEELDSQYEIQRTICEIRSGGWKKVALQFSDEMLVDAPRVLTRLRDELRSEEFAQSFTSNPASYHKIATNGIGKLDLTDRGAQVQSSTFQADQSVIKLCILADTSYGSCCVDEIAAEHINTEVVVHYGRACLSPTARLPVIYVFTSLPVNVDAAVASFKQVHPARDEKVCLMADIPSHHGVPALAARLQADGYTEVFATEVVRAPSSLLPNRTVPPEVTNNPEILKEYSIFHISSPPTSLLLILSARVKNIHIFDLGTQTSFAALEVSSAQLVRRRYALLMSVKTVPIFGILINTLSVANYMGALRHCQDIIRAAGKKAYVFVVGKLNAAKVANFSEIGGWVVIGCWESSLVESKDFYRPIITPFELETALTQDNDRIWGTEWIGDFSQLLGREQKAIGTRHATDWHAGGENSEAHQEDGIDQLSDDEPPEFDLRTGRYVSQSRPMGRAKPVNNATDTPGAQGSAGAPMSSAIVQRANGDLAVINGAASPAAEFLRSQRTWQGLGSDYDVAYERDEHGRIRGALVEEGRSGIARGYDLGDGDVRK